MDIHSVITRPLVTEKSTGLNAIKKYAVVVHPKATKIEIRRAIEEIYNTKVQGIRILTNPAKYKLMARGKTVMKRSPIKKAIITLKKGEKPIDFIKTKKKK